MGGTRCGFLALCLVLAVLAGTANVLADETDADGLTIERINVVGNAYVETSRILSVIRSKQADAFSAKEATVDAERIARITAIEQAWYNIKIAGDKVVLTFVVVEKRAVMSITFSGNEEYKSSTLTKQLGFKRGDLLDRALVVEATNKLNDYYWKKGYAFAAVTADMSQLEKGRVRYNITEGARCRIRKISFSGNSALKTRALKKVVKSKTRRFLVRPFYYQKQLLEDDVNRLKDAYQRKGYLDISIEAERVFSQDKKNIEINFKIVEGRLYIAEKILIKGNTFFDDETLESTMRIKQGAFYSSEQSQYDTENIISRYFEAGFVEAKVAHQRSFVTKGKILAEFDITEGDRYRIGEIDISGNSNTQDKVIRRILDEYEFTPGNWYNLKIARGTGSGELEKNVQGNVMAESATITPVSTTAAGQRDAHVSIVEGKTGMFMFGAGVDSQSGLIGQVVFNQRNFDIMNWPESWGGFFKGKAFKGAGQSLRLALEPGTDVSRYSLNFTEPYFMDKPITLDVIASSYERAREAYDEERIKGYVGFTRRMKNKWYKGIGLRLESVEVANVDTDAPAEITKYAGDNFLAGVRLIVGRDMTDNKRNPTSGYNFDVSYEQVGGDHTFGVLSGTYRRYKTLHEDLARRKTVLESKFHAATIVGDAPVFERFYAGGIGSIRGFDYRGISPRAGVDNDPTGSKWLVGANGQIEIPMVGETMSALFFVDTAMIDSGGARASVGTGIQIMIPQWFGPVPMRFEIASPVIKEEGDTTQAFSFSIGRLF